MKLEVPDLWPLFPQTPSVSLPERIPIPGQGRATQVYPDGSFLYQENPRQLV